MGCICANIILTSLSQSIHNTHIMVKWWNGGMVDNSRGRFFLFSCNICDLLCYCVDDVSWAGVERRFDLIPTIVQFNNGMWFCVGTLAPIHSLAAVYGIWACVITWRTSDKTGLNCHIIWTSGGKSLNTLHWIWCAFGCCFFFFFAFYLCFPLVAWDKHSFKQEYFI